MKQFLVLVFILGLLASCRSDHLKTLPETTTEQLLEQQRIKKRVEDEGVHGFVVMEMLGIPDKIYIENADRDLVDYWYYESSYPFYRGIVVCFENGITKYLKIVKSIKIQVEEAD